MTHYENGKRDKGKNAPKKATRQKTKNTGGSYQILLRSPFFFIVCNPFTQEHPKPQPTPTKSRFCPFPSSGWKATRPRPPDTTGGSFFHSETPRPTKDKTPTERTQEGKDGRREEGTPPPTRIGGKGCFTLPQILTEILVAFPQNFSPNFHRVFPEKSPETFIKVEDFGGWSRESPRKQFFELYISRNRGI